MKWTLAMQKNFIVTCSLSGLLLLAGCNGTTSSPSSGSGGSLTVSTIGSGGGTTVSYTSTGGYSSVTVDEGSQFLASNICSGSTVFGLNGSASCLIGSTTLILNNMLIESNACRTVGASQISEIAETSTFAGIALPTSGGYTYRDVPNVNLDDDGMTSSNGIAVTRPGSNCGEPISMGGSGLNSALLADRITHCFNVNGSSALWNGATNANSGQAIWKLVTRLGANNEVWQDTRTGLLWSSHMTTNATWCQGAGSNQADGQCNGNTLSYCAEVLAPASASDGTAGVWSTVYAPQKGGMGANSSPVVKWRLPSIADYNMGIVDGLAFVLPDLYVATDNEWTATISSSNHGDGWHFWSGGFYFDASFGRSSNNESIRCIGRSTL